MDYIKAGIVVVLGIIIYFVTLQLSTPGTANFFGLTYALLSLRVYQGLEFISSRASGTTA